jgi:release factor glutamine methyltransferase
MKTIEQAIQAASKCLERVGVENPRLESEFLIAAFLQMPRTRLVLNRHQELQAQKIRALGHWLRERQKRKPLAYVTGEQPFRDLNLKVSSAVLVPRPETELLVEQAMRVLDRSEKSVTVIDVGTGCGNIALCLSVHYKVQRVMAIDRSAAALRVARSNAKQIHRGAPINWMQGDLLTPFLVRRHPRGRNRGSIILDSRLRGNDKPSLIVANLPYVRTLEMENLAPELHWEPRLALDGGEDGLRLIEPCIHQAFTVLEPGGILLLEIGADQSRAVVELLRQSKVWSNVQVFLDLAGLPRIVQATQSPSPKDYK